LNNFMLIKT